MSLTRTLLLAGTALSCGVFLVSRPVQAVEVVSGAGVLVDGLASDWNLGTDFVSDLYRAGNSDASSPDYAVLAKLYQRYDCTGKIHYSLVLDVDGDGQSVTVGAAEAWIKIYGVGLPGDLLIDGNSNGGTLPRSFAWVHAIPGDLNSPVIGFEAGAQLDEGNYASAEAHLAYGSTSASTGALGFNEQAFSEQIENLNQPGTTRIRVTYPFEGGPALFPTTEIDYDGDGSADFTTTSWCIDTDHVIYNNTWYCTSLYSSFNYPESLDDTRWENLDVVNWILNQHFVGQSAGGFGTYTYGDVQYAIWSLVEDATSPNGLGSYDFNRINMILNAAAAAVGLDDAAIGYEPPCDGVVGVVLVPTNCASGSSQIVVAQMLVSEVPGICGGDQLAINLHCAPEEVGADDPIGSFELAPAYPNPFNPSTQLSVTLAETGSASLKVFDSAGREVATLFDGLRPAGTQSVVFRAEGLPSGVYFAVLTSTQGVATQKLLLIK